MPRRIVVETAAKNRGLTTLARVKTEMGISGSTHDTLLTTLIEQATGAIESATGRIFARQSYTETLRGTDDYPLVVTQRPVMAVTALTYDGATEDATDVILENPGAGILWLESLWTRSNTAQWAVTYTAGYLLPSDDVSGSDVAVASGNFTHASSAFPALLLAGDTLRATGFSEAANNADHIVDGTPSTSTISVETTLSDDAGDAAHILYFSQGLYGLPAVVERACIQLVRTGFQNRQRAANAQSVKVGDVAITWSDAELKAATSEAMVYANW